MTRELNDNELEGVAGGAIHKREEASCEYQRKKGNAGWTPDFCGYEVIDDKSGLSIERCVSEADAIEAAQKRGVSTKSISDTLLHVTRQKAKKDK